MKMKRSSKASATALNMNDALTFLDYARAQVDAVLDQLVPAENVEPKKLHGAIRWSLFAGGKRFRPALVLAVGDTFGASEEALIRTACALEMIHTYSLIHDDLPAMDDDDLRRGRPTCHIKFDEATAVLAGDVLQTLAFQSMAEDAKLTSDVRVRLISEIARAVGTPCGMVAGQTYDLEAESRIVSSEELERIHRSKTGALIEVSARAGAIIAKATGPELETITRYAERLGLLFQITDDLLDVTATAEDLGKTPGKDERAQKATYPSLYGLDETRAMADKVYKETIEALDQLDKPANPLRSIADFIRHRRA
jgi:geranylgeranyl pyrophosphate synthase